MELWGYLSEIRPVVIKIKASDASSIDSAISKVRASFPGAFVGRIQQAPDGFFVFVNANVEVEDM